MCIKENFWSVFNRYRVRNIISFITSSYRLVIFNRCNINNIGINMACKLKEKGANIMTIVVKKVPKFLRGFVKLIFGIKNT